MKKRRCKRRGEKVITQVPQDNDRPGRQSGGKDKAKAFKPQRVITGSWEREPGGMEGRGAKAWETFTRSEIFDRTEDEPRLATRLSP